MVVWWLLTVGGFAMVVGLVAILGEWRRAASSLGDLVASVKLVENWSPTLFTRRRGCGKMVSWKFTYTVHHEARVR